jgi:hypothetical protein
LLGKAWLIESLSEALILCFEVSTLDKTLIEALVETLIVVMMMIWVHKILIESRFFRI